MVVGLGRSQAAAGGPPRRMGGAKRNPSIDASVPKVGLPAHRGLPRRMGGAQRNPSIAPAGAHGRFAHYGVPPITLAGGEAVTMTYFGFD